jgi:3-oxoacyl-[acyl-carrier protein] reductase
MSKKLEGKFAIVTGASRGIGAAIAKRLASDGASVAITYAKDAKSAAAVVKAIEGSGGKAIAIQADSTDAEAIKGAVAKTVAAFGSLDILVNNAGTAIPKPFEEATIEEFDHVLNLNVRAVFVTTQAALKHMNNGGRIINIGSCVGERMMTPGLAAYSATKGAVKMFTQGLSREVGGRGITVNNCAAWSDRHGFESRLGRLGSATEGEHGAQPVWHRGRSCRIGCVRSQSRGRIHNRSESDRGRRNQRLSRLAVSPAT